MTGVAVIVPFKATGQKSRLSRILDARERRLLALKLLRGVLRAVRAAGLSGSCYVVTSDEDALNEAERAGASCIREVRDSGVNSAVFFAMRTLRTADRFMVLPSDLPLLAPDELGRLLSLGGASDVVISPSSSFNGTNVLLFSRARRPALSYDKDSFWNHLASVARRGLSAAVYTGRGVVFDLDSVSDARRLIRTAGDVEVARFLRTEIGK